jgi:ankyrin repeat protein
MPNSLYYTRLAVNYLKNGNFPGAKELVNFLQKEQATEVINAIKHHDTYKLKQYKANGIDLNAPDHHGNTPYQAACKYNFLDVSPLIESFKYTPMPLDMHGRTPVHHAAINADISTLRDLLKSDISKINFLDKSGNAPIHYLTQNSEEVEPIVQLISYGADPYLRNSENGLTPLHIAAFDGGIKKVNHLMNYYSNNINIQDDFGFSPLHAAVFGKNIPVIKYLLEFGYGNIDPNITSKDEGCTPLHIAVIKGYVATVECLLSSSKTSIEIPDAMGKTPVNYAYSFDNRLDDSTFLEIQEIFQANRPNQLSMLPEANYEADNHAADIDVIGGNEEDSDSDFSE